ncbi:UDP-N-acetylmuramoyl-tripeptide--D-alanyl-D-alanine ligase [Thioalkalivibrio sp.]|uniref:UDP-N-acetylmuramoyl-tripeptide--D-alanyl-D- alanine ligase n=1 Tax=Thioalkalivibrio sp. TaxID=2093813 RepID=UPI003563ACF4
MIELLTGEVARLVGGELHGPDDVRILGVSRDSREQRPQALFVALRGQRFDGHDFIGPQLAAAALMVERRVDDPRPWILVDDTLAALAHLASAWRARCPARVLALTGSNGKTTTKEMLRAVLSRVGRVHATRGNLNNHIGVPLTLLELPADADFAVIEMGANHGGEIAQLTQWTQPDVALITNAGRAHLDGFGSLDGVARAKGEIYQGLSAGSGTAVVNLDDRFADYWLSLNRDRRCTGFSLQGLGDVRGVWQHPDRLELDLHGARRQLTLAAPGRHIAQNALAAAAAATAVGCGIEDIARGLEDWRPVAGRMRVFREASGARIWDDTYNANPESLVAALQVLAADSGETVLVLGDMSELGHGAREMHAEMGRKARELGVHRLLALGSLTPAAVEAFGPGAEWFPSHAALASSLRASLQPGMAVLIKGSRSQRMEAVLAALELEAAQADGGVAHAAGAR